MPAKTGLDALLRPEDSILVLIDHRPYQFANLNSHERTMIVNNVIGPRQGRVLGRDVRYKQLTMNSRGRRASRPPRAGSTPGAGYGESEQLQRGELKESFLLQHIREVALDRLASSPAPTT